MKLKSKVENEEGGPRSSKQQERREREREREKEKRREGAPRESGVQSRRGHMSQLFLFFPSLEAN